MYLIRDGVADDLNFILDSWVKSYGPSPYARAMGRVGSPKELFYVRAEARARALIQVCPVKLACDASDPDVIIGWACGAPPFLHYVFVKTHFRHNGIAKHLLSSLGFKENEVCLVGCQTDMSMKIKFPEKWTWDPMAAADSLTGIVVNYA